MRKINWDGCDLEDQNLEINYLRNEVQGCI